MITNNPSQLRKSLSLLDINGLARQTRFSIRHSRKISPELFLIGFFQMVMTGRFSLRLWASNLSVLYGSTISFQAIAKKLDFRQEPFFHMLFQQVLMCKLQQKLRFKMHDILKPFRRVIIEDSTCFKLPKNLFDFFPGAKLPHGRVAGGKLQLRFNLKSHNYESIALQSYCQNDQSFAADILNSIQKGDLIIRDLGYWSIRIFKEIIQRKAYFLSRLRLDVNLLAPVNQQLINLPSLLKKKERQGINQIDMQVWLSDKYKVPVRLVGIKLTEEQTEKRRRMAKAQRHKNTRISKKANYLLSWNLFITNVNANTWNIISVCQVYSLRWHIEMIFKCWKSKFNFESFFKHCNGRNPVKPEIILLLVLSWIALYFIPRYNQIANVIWKQYHRILSPLRFADFILSHLDIAISNQIKMFLPVLAYCSCYDKRKDRFNHFEKTYMNFLS